MGLTCECGDFSPDPGQWYWNEAATDYKVYPFKRRRKCCSCGETIELSALCTEHKRVKVPESDVECNIYGDDGEVPLASDWMCERCSDLYLSLESLGYCVSPRDDMRELVKEYAMEHNSQNEAKS